MRAIRDPNGSLHVLDVPDTTALLLTRILGGLALPELEGARPYQYAVQNDGIELYELLCDAIEETGRDSTEVPEKAFPTIDFADGSFAVLRQTEQEPAYAGLTRGQYLLGDGNADSAPPAKPGVPEGVEVTVSEGTDDYGNRFKYRRVSIPGSVEGITYLRDNLQKLIRGE